MSDHAPVTRRIQPGPASSSLAALQVRPGCGGSRPGGVHEQRRFAIHELLGHHNIKNYDGSWTEYGSLVGVPIELGA
jgi:thiosulfate/3-mercaptopyruvate sulfurtransferase